MNTYTSDWKGIAKRVKDDAGWKCVRCGHAHEVASGHMLTVHHFDMDKANNADWNLMALCQKCHLSVQARVRPHQAFAGVPSAWALPYIAGFYVDKKCGDTNPAFDLEKWVAEYERKIGPWPSWAPGVWINSVPFNVQPIGAQP